MFTNPVTAWTPITHFNHACRNYPSLQTLSFNLLRVRKPTVLEYSEGPQTWVRQAAWLPITDLDDVVYCSYLWSNDNFCVSRHSLKVVVKVRDERPNTLRSNTDPFSVWVPRAPSPSGKQLKRNANNSRPFNAEAKNAWIHASTPPHLHIKWYVIYTDTHL